MGRIPEKVISLANAIHEAGGRAMLNGGCVRDELMGVAPSDWDLEVYGIEPDELADAILREAAADPSTLSPEPLA